MMINTKFRFGALLASVTLLALVGSASAQTDPTPAKTSDGHAPQTSAPQPPVPDTYILGPEDLLTIVVRDVPESSGDFMIRLDGKITFPMIGEVTVAGKTAGELRKELEKGLSKELRDPSVTVNIHQMRINRIYILGAVNRPFIYDYRPGWRITELVSAAGGLSTPAERCKAILFRAGEPTRTIPMKDVFELAKPEANVQLQLGDVLNIQPDVTVHVTVIGEVHQSGPRDLYEGQGAVEALAAAGGGLQDSALSKSKIVRNRTEVPVDLYKAVILGQSDQNVVLKDGDTLYVPTVVQRIAVVGVVNHPGSQILPDGRVWTVTMAVTEAGGPAQTAKLDAVIIQRYDDKGKVTPIIVNYRKLGAKAGQVDIPLQDKDVVYVSQSGATNINQVGTLGNLYFILKAIFNF